jgi:hypothetical protein
MVFPMTGGVYNTTLFYTKEKINEEGIWILH